MIETPLPREAALNGADLAPGLHEYEAAMDERHVAIRPPSGWAPVDLRELWQYRELWLLLTWRNVSVRYKQTLLGAGWAILQPLFNMVVFTLLFGNLAHIPSDGVPYALFSFAGLLPWTYFSQALTAAGNSVYSNANLLTKVYFPRLIIPLSAVCAGLIDFGLAFVVLLGMMAFFRQPPVVNMLLLPVFLLLALVTALGVGLWLAAMGVRYRDVRLATPFLVQFWMFVSPVIYPASLVPARFQWVYHLNPMASVLEGFRWCLLGIQPPSDLLSGTVLSTAISGLMLVTGAFYFRRMERTFADEV